MKTDVNTSNLFKRHTSHTVEEVLAAGGTTAFSIKQNKSAQALIEALQNAPQAEPFTDEEWDSLLKQMENDK